MTSIDSARQLLARTEAELRKLLTDAASSGDYGSVVEIAAWARALGAMVGGGKNPASGQVGVTKAKKGATKPATPAAKSRTRSPAASKNYPIFFRQVDRLVRVSWSKRDRKEYEHKAPVAVVTELASRITEVGTEGRVFMTEELLPIRDAEGNEVPTYQVYVSLSLLRQVGLVEQHGRQGYSVPRLSELKSSVAAVFKNLPER